MWKREKVQKMPRCLTSKWLLFSLLAAAAHGGILPDQLGTSKRGPAKADIPSDPVLVEYGIDAAEEAAYGPMTVVAWRFHDTTGSMAAFQYQRPADAKPSKFEKLAVKSGKTIIATHGNYLFQFTGGEPDEKQYNQLLFNLPRIEQSSLPVISTYLPPEGLIPNSERYITGPVALAKFQPGLPPSAVAFHMSAEGQYGRYRTNEGHEMNVAIFAYPTPAIARERADALGKVPGTVTKRTGSLVVLTVNPPNGDDAERLLGKINYSVSLTWNERPNDNVVQSTAQMLVSIFKLAGIIILFCLLSGFAFAGFRYLGRRSGKQDADGQMITLHLGSK